MNSVPARFITAVIEAVLYNVAENLGEFDPLFADPHMPKFYEYEAPPEVRALSRLSNYWSKINVEVASRTRFLRIHFSFPKRGREGMVNAFYKITRFDTPRFGLVSRETDTTLDTSKISFVLRLILSSKIPDNVDGLRRMTDITRVEELLRAKNVRFSQSTKVFIPETYRESAHLADLTYKMLAAGLNVRSPKAVSLSELTEAIDFDRLRQISTSRVVFEDNHVKSLFRVFHNFAFDHVFINMKRRLDRKAVKQFLRSEAIRRNPSNTVVELTPDSKVLKCYKTNTLEIALNPKIVDEFLSKLPLGSRRMEMRCTLFAKSKDRHPVGARENALEIFVEKSGFIRTVVIAKSAN